MPRTKTNTIAEFGDFQTPPALATRVCALLRELGVHAESVVEPTCGRGAFLFAAADAWPSATRFVGFDVSAEHLAVATDAASVHPRAADFILDRADFFRVHWWARLSELPAPLLIIGNPPWVTNSQVGALGGSNLPFKSNFQGHDGFDAITGKANFDISEWMLIHLAKAIYARDATLAMLVKTVVARKVLQHLWRHDFPVTDAALFKIDATAHFNAAVDATLLLIRFAGSSGRRDAKVYDKLSTEMAPTATIGFADGSVVADLDAYRRTEHLNGGSPLKWRSGIKHDCSKVMELRTTTSGYRNGFGDIVDLEPDFLFPMLKTSEVASGCSGTRCARRMLVPQRRIGDDTSVIERQTPKTWRYLLAHRALLDKRGSSIYRGRPPFSVFGVGDYSFSPWKVAISGMYKSLNFVKVGCFDKRPVVLDDVTNFLPCPTEEAADLMVSMLCTSTVKEFFNARTFWDAKRPITVELLSRLNLLALADELGSRADFEKHFGAEHVPKRRRQQQPTLGCGPTLW